jgi:hypothetical protein
MEQEKSKPSGNRRTKFGLFLPGFRKNTENKSHPGSPPNLIQTGASDPAFIQQGPSIATASTAVALVESAAPAVEDFRGALNSDDDEERRIVLAKSWLNKAGEDLKNNIPPDILGSTNFEIKASADINSLADNIGLALVTMLDRRSIEKSRQTHFQGLVIEWAKKTIPFIETGLTVANVKLHPQGTY